MVPFTYVVTAIGKICASIFVAVFLLAHSLALDGESSLFKTFILLTTNYDFKAKVGLLVEIIYKRR